MRIKLREVFNIEQRKQYKPKFIARNTIKYGCYGIEHIRYWYTNILTTDYNAGTFTMNTGGWWTITTKKHLNKYIPYGCIYQSRHIWYFSVRDLLPEDQMSLTTQTYPDIEFPAGIALPLDIAEYKQKLLKGEYKTVYMS